MVGVSDATSYFEVMTKEEISIILIGDSIFNGLENSILKMRNIIKKAVK